MGNIGLYEQALVAADLTLDLLKGQTTLVANNLRSEVYYNRALTHGELRDFTAALSDTNSALRLTPSNVKAKRMLKNCKEAERLETGPKHRRWEGPLDAVTWIDDKAWVHLYLNIGSGILVVLIALFVAWYSSYVNDKSSGR